MNSFTLRFIYLLYDFELFFPYSVRLFIGEYEVKNDMNGVMWCYEVLS